MDGKRLSSFVLRYNTIPFLNHLLYALVSPFFKGRSDPSPYAFPWLLSFILVEGGIFLGSDIDTNFGQAANY